MSETDDTRQADQAAAEQPAATAKADMQFAYHAGPPDVIFAGRTWRRGVPQPVTRSELRDMSRRAGWAYFEFRREPASN